MDNQGRMMAVAVQTDGHGEFDFSKPTPLFSRENGVNDGLDRSWDVSADGKRFLFVEGNDVAEGGETALELVLIQNWADELTRVAPREP